MLARREHSARELETKLTQRGFPAEVARTEIERLAAAGLQSDTRFARLFVEQRIQRGDGPLKIRAALQERGTDAEALEAALAAEEEDWTGRAAEAARRRFGATPPADWRERAKRARFLQQRGFPADVVRRVTEFDEALDD